MRRGDGVSTVSRQLCPIMAITYTLSSQSAHWRGSNCVHNTVPEVTSCARRKV